MFRVSLSESLLLNVLLPGVICLIGIVWITISLIGGTIDPSIGEFLKSRGTDSSGSGVLLTGLLAAAALVAYLLAMFVGTVIAVFLGYVEWHVLDAWQAKKLNLSRTEYEAQWNRYINSLEKAHNSYVTKQVTAFHFEARCAIALLIMFLCVVTSSSPRFLVWGSAAGLALFLFRAAYDDHRVLAEFRRRRFGNKPDPSAKPEDLLQDLVNDWCSRNELVPLQLVLQVLGDDANAISDPEKALKVLHQLAELPAAQVSPLEKCRVSLIIAALTERTASAR
jgi:hypothetical protein